MLVQVKLLVSEVTTNALSDKHMCALRTRFTLLVANAFLRAACTLAILHDSPPCPWQSYEHEIGCSCWLDDGLHISRIVVWQQRQRVDVLLAHRALRGAPLATRCDPVQSANHTRTCVVIARPLPGAEMAT